LYSTLSPNTKEAKSPKLLLIEQLQKLLTCSQKNESDSYFRHACPFFLLSVGLSAWINWASTGQM
jgi:hypothetical protein